MFLERQALKVAARVADLSFILKQNINNNKKEIIKEFRPKIKTELPTISEMVLTHFYVLYTMSLWGAVLSVLMISQNIHQLWKTLRMRDAL